MDDLLQIQQLYARYAWALDDRRDEEWLECFTDNGSVESSMFGRFEGREDLRRFLAKYQNAFNTMQLRHLNSNLVIDIFGDRAEGRCYLVLYSSRRGRADTNAIGIYRDQLQQIEGRWLFVSRKVTYDYSGRWT
jgi:3-phenylpropionate/cinnamic acid dioxygenase small subunit